MPQILFNAKNFFLTYPCFLISPHDFAKQFNEKFTGVIAGLCVAAEAPEETDENYHLHVLVSFESKRRVTRVNYFDIEGHHPNIQTAFNVGAVHAYCHKGEGSDPAGWTGCGQGDGVLVVCSGDVFQEPVGGPLDWGALVDSAQDRAGFLSAVRRYKPRDYVINYAKVEYWADKHFAPEPVPYSGPVYQSVDFLPNANLDAWERANLVG